MPNPLSSRTLVAYASLALFLHELHELAHTTAGRFVCGAWGTRDFNVWQLATGCSSWIPTSIGPLFSYAVMYAGVLLMRKERLRMLGIALALAPNPFARLFTAVMGGGDEMVLARVAADSGKTPMLRVAVLVVVSALVLPPIVAAWRALASARHRGWSFAVLLLAPMALTGILLFVIGNRLLAAGFLAAPALGGDPLLVSLSTAVVGVMTLLTARWLVEGPTRPADGARRYPLPASV